MNLLAIETSSPVLSVAIQKAGGKIRQATVKGYMKHAEHLLPLIDRLLRQEKLKIGDIDAFLISRGPGSFTGLRIGFATLLGFLATQPKPCYGAYSLDVIAAALRSQGILVRHFNQPRIEQYLRISIGTPAQCDALVQSLGSVLAGLTQLGI